MLKRLFPNGKKRQKAAEKNCIQSLLSDVTSNDMCYKSDSTDCRDTFPDCPGTCERIYEVNRTRDYCNVPIVMDSFI